MASMTIGTGGSYAIWAEYPIITSFEEKAIRNTVISFGRDPDLVNGFVEFNVDLGKWRIEQDEFLKDLPNAKMIPLVTLDGDISYLGKGFPLYEPGVNPKFFDKTGGPI